MKMYLHQSWTDIILTLNWIPRTKGEMVGAWFACFFSAIFVQVSKRRVLFFCDFEGGFGWEI